MDRPSLVEAVREGSISVPRLRGGRLDLSSDQAKKCLWHLYESHGVFRKELHGNWPEANVEHEYSILFNGLVVSGVSREELARIPGVKSVTRTDTTLYTPTLDATLDMIGVSDFWQNLGGQEFAGEGVRVAVIDTGIDILNPFFDPAQFAMPVGYPLGETAFTTAKVIAARAYFRSGDPVNLEKDTDDPVDHRGHGSHCAGIVAGNMETVFDLSGTPVTVSGVAPRAYLMNYKVFYTAESGQSGAYDPELMAAFEDAVVDGADVISCSWGGPDDMVEGTAASVVYTSAIDAGAVVVFAAGNEGNGPGTISHPGTLPDVLTVGSFDAGRFFAGLVEVVTPAPVPADLAGMPAIKGSISPSFDDDPVGPLPVISARTAGGGTNNDGCLAFPWDAFDGAIALIERGNCTFSSKVTNAYLAGAPAVIIFNNLDQADPMTMGGVSVPIPAVQLGNIDGIELEKWVIDNPGATATINDGMHSYFGTGSVEPMAGSSGRGPTDDPVLKPDIVAPGVRVLSADAHSVGNSGDPWDLKSGTSMATPHVAGAAALVRQRYPALDPREVQSLLTGSARLPNKRYFRILSIGAGLMDLTVASDALSFAIPCAFSLGEGHAGTLFAATVQIGGPFASDGNVEIQWHHLQDSFDPPVIPMDGETIALMDSALTVAVQTPFDAPAGEYAGRVLLESGTQKVTIPYHYRVFPPLEYELMLLDMSFRDPADTTLLDLYTDMAQEAGLAYTVYQLHDGIAAPPLEELLRHFVVLVFTGDDQVSHKGTIAKHTFDALSTYASKGGNIVITGQGPLRGNEHSRIDGFMGGVTSGSFPLFDQYTQDVVELEDYLVHPIDEAPSMLDMPLDIGPETDGIGNLVMAGELGLMMGPGLPDIFVQPFLKMYGEPFGEGGGVVGVLFDPYLGYGEYTEMETLKYRAALLGFGLERVGSATSLTDGRQELFESLMLWVSERISLSVQTTTTDRYLILDAEYTGGPLESLEIDFGDGSDPSFHDAGTIYYEYDDLGEYTVEVLARASMGAADIERVQISLTEIQQPVESDAGQGQSIPLSEEIEPRFRDCGCAQVGGGDRDESLLILLLPLLLLIF